MVNNTLKAFFTPRGSNSNIAVFSPLAQKQSANPLTKKVRNSVDFGPNLSRIVNVPQNIATRTESMKNSSIRLL